MAYIKNYNKTLHDIYTFNGDPVFNRSTPPGIGSSVQPLGWNLSSLLKNPNYNLPDIDWSGLDVRNRSFMTYGWNDFDPWGVECNSDYGSFCINSRFPNAFKQWYKSGGLNYDATRCYDLGCPPGNFDPQTNEIYDFNKWNNGAWGGVIISPQHVLVTLHYSAPNVGINLTKTWRFLGKNGKFYTKTSTARAYTGLNAVYDLVPLGIPLDFAIYKFDEPLTPEEKEQITIYPIAKAETVFPGTKIYVQDPNGKLIIEKITGYSINNVGPNSSVLELLPNISYIMTENDFSQNLPYEYVPQRGIAPHVGDSGSPMLIYVQNKTCFLGLRNGGTFAGASSFREILAEFIKNDTIDSYDIEFINCGYVSGIEIDDGVSDIIIPPLKKFPYNSEYGLNFETINEINIGFFGQSRVFCQDLNRIQEMFLNQQSKTIEMIHNYFGNRLTTEFTAKPPIILDDTLLDLYTGIDDIKVSTITPLYQNQVSINVGKQIVISRGWYFVKSKLRNLISYQVPEFVPLDWTPVESNPNDIKNYDIYKWFYNNYELVIDPVKDNYCYLNLKTTTSNNLINATGETDINHFINIDYFQQDPYLVLSPNPTTNLTELKPLIFYTDSAGVSYLANGTLIG